jgi:pseudouridine synthase
MTKKPSSPTQTPPPTSPESPAEGPVRVQKLLAVWGIASRRTIETWITAGKIAVNGEVLREQGCKVDPLKDVITVDGKVITPPLTETPVVQVLNKPYGILTSLGDPFGRETIKDFLPATPRLYPVGRLDGDSTGLLLVTNHGELANRLMHPRHKVEKEYLVTLQEAILTPEELRRFAEGLLLNTTFTAPCRIEEIGPLRYRVVLKEGRNRQIRRMFALLGHDVARLHRVRVGPITLGDLPFGKLRPVTPLEYRDLLELTGLEPGQKL